MLQPYPTDAATLLIQDQARKAPVGFMQSDPDDEADGTDITKETKNFDLSRLMLLSAWKKGIFTALPGVLVITFLAFPVVSALVRRLGSNPRGTSRHHNATRRAC